MYGVSRYTLLFHYSMPDEVSIIEYKFIVRSMYMMFKGAFYGVYCTLFILAKDSKSLRDLKKKMGVFYVKWFSRGVLLKIGPP